jgi:hypothetical protein
VTNRLVQNSWRLSGLVFALLTQLFLSSCAAGYRNPKDPDDNLVEYQFIDADTMKPIQGAYVNVVWMSPGVVGKVNGSKCLQAVLLRSDVNGWVRMDGPKGSYRVVPWIMVPGYEDLQLTYFVEPEVQTHIISIYRRTYEDLRAWGDALQAMGYKLIDLPGNTNVQFRKNFDYIPRSKSGRTFTGSQRYFVTNRSFPGAEALTNVANGCGSEGINIGLSEAERAETGTRRGIQQLKQVCDERWDTAKGGYPDQALAQALWLVEPPMQNTKAWERMRAAIPTYQVQLSAFSSPRKMTSTERIAFCAWMQPFAEKYQ